MDFISTREELRAVYKQPEPTTLDAQGAEALDRHCRAFIARSPFVLIGSSDGNGNADVTPKGDKPGFVAVLDDITIAIPDRPGNNRLDTLENIVVNPAVGLLFLIPGMNETLRVNGEARITLDAGLARAAGGRGQAAAQRRSWSRSRRPTCIAPRRSCARSCGSRKAGPTAADADARRDPEGPAGA